MELSKKEKILIFVTIVLVIVLAVGFYYDRSYALIDRTNYVVVSKDSNLKLEKINKTGFLYCRQSYEAKFRIINNKWEPYYDMISKAYGGGGGFCTIEGYKEFESQALTKNALKPQPKADATVWIMGAKLGPDTTKNVVYIIDTEADGNAYLYIYYSRT